MTLSLEPASIGLATRRLGPGAAVGSRYRIQAALGTGREGVVWQAIDEVLERPVALKISSQETARFVDAARGAAGLWHPNLIQIFDFGQAEEQAYLVTEYLPGGRLQECFHRTDINPGQLRRLACDLLSALAYLHSRDLVHGSVDARHVLLDGDGSPHLSGFGALPAGPGASPADDLIGLGRLLASAPCRREQDPGLDDLIGVLSRSDRHDGPVRAYEALDTLQVCTTPAGQETEEFDVRSILGEEPAPVPVVARARPRSPGSPRPRWAPQRVLVAIGLHPAR